MYVSGYRYTKTLKNLRIHGLTTLQAHASGNERDLHLRFSQQIFTLVLRF